MIKLFKSKNDSRQTSYIACITTEKGYTFLDTCKVKHQKVTVLVLYPIYKSAKYVQQNKSATLEVP